MQIISCHQGAGMAKKTAPATPRTPRSKKAKNLDQEEEQPSTEKSRPSPDTSTSTHTHTRLACARSSNINKPKLITEITEKKHSQHYQLMQEVTVVNNICKWGLNNATSVQALFGEHVNIFICICQVKAKVDCRGFDKSTGSCFERRDCEEADL